MSSGSISCGACGAANDPAAIVCDRCGALLAAYQTPADAAAAGSAAGDAPPPAPVVQPVSPSPVDPVVSSPVTTTPPLLASPPVQRSAFPAGHTLLGSPGPVSLSTTPAPRPEVEPAAATVSPSPVVPEPAVAARTEEPVVAEMIEAMPAANRERLEPVKIAWIDRPFEQDEPRRPTSNPAAPLPAPRQPEWARVPDQRRPFNAGQLQQQLRPALDGVRAGAPPQLIAVGVAVLGFSCVAFAIGGAIDGAGCLASLGLFGVIVAIALIGAGMSKKKR